MQWFANILKHKTAGGTSHNLGVHPRTSKFTSLWKTVWTNNSAMSKCKEFGVSLFRHARSSKSLFIGHDLQAVSWRCIKDNTHIKNDVLNTALWVCQHEVKRISQTTNIRCWKKLSSAFGFSLKAGLQKLLLNPVLQRPLVVNSKLKTKLQVQFKQQSVSRRHRDLNQS